MTELRNARLDAGLSQRALAELASWSQSEINRLEQHRFDIVSVRRLCEVGAVLGLETAAGFYPTGDAVRDRPQQRVAQRFEMRVSCPPYVLMREVLFPNVGDRRAWDVVLRIAGQLTGVEIQTRVRDVQACVRRIRERERDGGVDEILVVLADTAWNRRLIDELRQTFGARFATSPRQILAALGAGRPIPGAGVILI